METVNEVLSYIQKKISVPKGRENKFGNYKYRSAEDIVDAVTKIMPEDAFLLVSDEVVLVGDRYYVQATAGVYFNKEALTATGLARESEAKKGMDSSQITGASSSYAKKYALCNLFAIDDGNDADGQDCGPKTYFNTATARNEVWKRIHKDLDGCKSVEEVDVVWLRSQVELWKIREDAKTAGQLDTFLMADEQLIKKKDDLRDSFEM